MATATQTTQTTQATETIQATETAQVKEPTQHSIGALFATSSEAIPFVGKADATLLEAISLEAPEGKDWKIFCKAKVSKKGKPFLSVYLGLSDIDR